MGINRWSGGTEDRKRNEKEAKTGDEVPKGTRAMRPHAWKPRRDRLRTPRSAGSWRSSETRILSLPKRFLCYRMDPATYASSQRYLEDFPPAYATEGRWYDPPRVP